MEKKYILSLDQGTTSSRAVLFDRDASIIGSVSKEYPQIYPKEGWVEHNPSDIISSELYCMKKVISDCGIGADEIAAIGITNQRETAIVWDRKTGEPVYNAIVWQCRRTAGMIEEMKECFGAIREKTGLVPDAYFSASKVRWILDNVPGARERAENGELAFGTVDSYLIWTLTDGRIHATDRTNASRTMLYNIDTLSWDNELCEMFDIPMNMLPTVKASGDFYGSTVIDGCEIPICGVAGDQQAALFGQGCFSAGDAKNTYGTGCFLLMNTGGERLTSANGLLTTLAATASDMPVQYALEGSVFIGGSVVQWLRDELRIISDSRDIEYFASKVSDNGGVYLVPAFTGLGAPYWDMNARGTITGLTRGTKREHIIRAAEESIAYQCADLIAAMEKDTGREITALSADGGAVRDSFLMQFQADVSDRRVIRPRILESTALGAAFLAGLTCSFWKNTDELAAKNSAESEFVPTMDSSRRASLLDGWHRAVRRTTANIE